MVEVTQIRLINLRRLIDQLGGPTALASKLKYSNGSYISQMAGPTPTRAIGEKVARQIEKSLGYEPGWMDVDHSGPRERGAVPELRSNVVSLPEQPAKTVREFAVGEELPPRGPRDLPVFGAFKGGFDGAEINYHDPVERIERPTELIGVAKACGIYFTNDSMEPRYFQGEMGLVHPGKPVRPGDYVAVELTNGNGLVKRLVRQTAEFVELEQHNPPEKRKIPRREIAGLYKIVGTRSA